MTAVAPADDAAGVPTTTTVRVTFSEPMDEAATAAAFGLAGPFGSVGGATSWSGSTLTFTPFSTLARATTYTATVTTAAADLAGNTLAAPLVWSFETAARRR